MKKMCIRDRYILLYDLQWMVKVEEIENILTKREINEFWEVFLDVLSYRCV